MYNYFQALINLMAHICMERNYKGINALTSIYTLDMVIDCTLSDKLPYAMRARFARLLMSLHMDKDPLEALNVPIMTRVWDEVEKVELPRNTNVPKKLLQLKPALESFIRSSKGICRVWETDFNMFMLEALKIIETMIRLGFYESEEEIISICQPLIQLLDGSIDYTTNFEESAHKDQIKRDGNPNQPLLKSKEQNLERIKKSLKND